MVTQDRKINVFVTEQVL